MKRYLCLALICAATTTLTAQTTSSWNGTWKLDHAKSHLTGTTYTFSKGDNGMWIFTEGRFTFTFAPNGKPYPVVDKSHT